MDSEKKEGNKFMSTWDMIMGYDPPPGVQAAIDEKERRETTERNIADSAASLKELSMLLEQEHQARLEAEKLAEVESERANRLARWSLWISILSAAVTIIGVAFDIYATFHGANSCRNSFSRSRCLSTSLQILPIGKSDRRPKPSTPMPPAIKPSRQDQIRFVSKLFTSLRFR